MTVPSRQTYSIDEIKLMLVAQAEAVARHYAPFARGAFVDGHQYWTLNPGRADRSVGSFVVHISGAKCGRWNDYATGEHGDLIDLIALALGCDARGALREARSWLGLETDSPEDIARRKAAAEAQARRIEAARREDAEKREKARKRAEALWLSAQERIRGTPVEAYLRDTRGIDLAVIGRQPRALRYHPEVFYRHVDASTGEVIEGKFPAMLAIATDGQGRPVACHRTWLALRPDGRWDKAPVPKAKKVLGDYAGASIHLWSGLGPRGGKGAPLSEAPQGSHVFIAEGIEDALSCVMALPAARVICAISLSNFAGVVLPPTVTDITLIADQDEGREAQDTLTRAVNAHAKAGRRVRVWRNRDGGKDLNDALRQRVAAEKTDNGGHHA